jgi:hypothetical protein
MNFELRNLSYNTHRRVRGAITRERSELIHSKLKTQNSKLVKPLLTPTTLWRSIVGNQEKFYGQVFGDTEHVQDNGNLGPKRSELSLPGFYFA